MTLLASYAVGYTEKCKNGSFFTCSDEHTERRIPDKIRDSLKKDYFTPFEREDILMITLLLSELADETYDLLCCALSVNTQGATALTSFLYDAVKHIKEFILSLSGFPKTNDFSVFFEKWNGILTEFRKAELTAIGTVSQNMLINRISDCMRCCRRIMNYAGYSIIKNS